jgi:hypothetical protein
LRKLPEEQRQYLFKDINNFRISSEEFLDYYKMISFIFEKDEIFEKIIKTEWSQAITLDNDDKMNNNKNNSLNNDESDDYDEYNVKPNEITNYKKLKNDLLTKHDNCSSNKSNSNNNYLDEDNYNDMHQNEIRKIPINKIPRQNSNSNIHQRNNNRETDQRRIFRPSISNKQFNKTEINQNPIMTNISPLEKLTNKLKLRGLRGLMNLHKQFIFTCPNLSKISLTYFIQVLKNQKITFDQNEYRELFDQFNNDTNYLDFARFIREFKKPLNDARLSAVEDAFSLLDVDSNDNIYIDTIKKKYNPKGNPLVKKGIKNEEEISTEFLDCFELNYNLLTAVENQNVTNVVSFEEFANFYEYVSFLYEDDNEFVQMVNESWDD